MTSRERLLCVLRGEMPDRAPISPFVQEEYLSYYFNKSNTSRLYDAVALAKELDFDLMTRQYVNPVPYFMQRSAPGWQVAETKQQEGDNYVRTTLIKTPGGTLRQREAAPYNEKILSGIHFSTVEYLIKSKEDYALFKQYCPPRTGADDEHILNAGREARAAVGDLGVTSPWAIGGVFNLVATYMDIQKMMTDPMMDSAYFADYMEFFTDMVVADHKVFAQSEFDVVGIQGNMANAMVGNKYFEKYVLPYEKRAVDVLNEAGKPSVYHNCGKAKPLYPSYKQLGITVWETVSPAPQGDNTLADAKAYFGDALVLAGNFDQVKFLKQATPQQVEEAAYQQMLVGKEGGHYIFACSDYLEVGTPLENVKALLRGARAAADY